MKCDNCIVGWSTMFLGFGITWVRETDTPWRYDTEYNHFNNCPDCGRSITTPALGGCRYA